MSFNTFNLFNFFQQPNTGRIPQKSEYVNSELDQPKIFTSGKVADFNWKFPYFNKNIPRVIFDAGAKNPIYLFSDANDENIFGLRTPVFSNNLSGKFYKDTNNTFLNLNINGKVFPHNKDLSNSKINLSGFFKESPRIVSSIRNSISGSINDFNFNFNSVSTKISGYLEDVKTNFNFLKSEISGFISGEPVYKNNIDLKISGLFFPISKDFANIEYYISEYSSKSLFKYEIKTGDSINLNYYINSYGVGV